jgi:hypothetical protein
MKRRKLGRALAGVGALAAFGWAAWAAHTNAMPELRVFDGYRIVAGAAVTVLVIAPFVWRWRRDRSLLAIAAAAAAGGVMPLAVSAYRLHMPLLARLRGSWTLAGADLVAPAMVVGFVCLWLALREWTPR